VVPVRGGKGRNGTREGEMVLMRGGKGRNGACEGVMLPVRGEMVPVKDFEGENVTREKW